MASDLEVRLAVPGDGPAVAALVAAWAQEGQQEGQQEDQQEDRLEDQRGAKHAADADAIEQAVRHCVDDPAHLLLVAVAADKGEIAGYIAVHWIPFPMLGGTEAYVSDLIVARARRGDGVGRALADAAELAARERGCRRLMLNNRVGTESFARDFYPKLGYRARDDFRGFVKPLTGSAP